MTNQLSKELTSEILEKENKLLSEIHFPQTPKQFDILGGQNNESNNFNPLSWYAEEPCEDDQLY